MVVSSCSAARKAPESVRSSRIAVRRVRASGWSTTSTSTGNETTGPGTRIAVHLADRGPVVVRGMAGGPFGGGRSRGAGGRGVGEEAGDALGEFVRFGTGEDAAGAERTVLVQNRVGQDARTAG